MDILIHLLTSAGQWCADNPDRFAEIIAVLAAAFKLTESQKAAAAAAREKVAMLQKAARSELLQTAARMAYGEAEWKKRSGQTVHKMTEALAGLDRFLNLLDGEPSTPAEREIAKAHWTATHEAETKVATVKPEVC